MSLTRPEFHELKKILKKENPHWRFYHLRKSIGTKSTMFGAAKLKEDVGDMRVTTHSPIIMNDSLMAIQHPYRISRIDRLEVYDSVVFFVEKVK